MIDSSGLRFTYTNMLREHDAGILETGHVVNGIQHIIPPNDESFLSHGECSAQCMEAVCIFTNLKWNILMNHNKFKCALHGWILGSYDSFHSQIGDHTIHQHYNRGTVQLRHVFGTVLYSAVSTCYRYQQRCPSPWLLKHPVECCRRGDLIGRNSAFQHYAKPILMIVCSFGWVFGEFTANTNLVILFNKCCNDNRMYICNSMQMAHIQIECFIWRSSRT